MMAAKRVSLIPSPLDCGPDFEDGSTNARLDGDELEESDCLDGRHLRTASIEALQG